MELKIVMSDFLNVSKYADYSTFHVADEASGYRLSVGGYSGNAGSILIVCRCPFCSENTFLKPIDNTLCIYVYIHYFQTFSPNHFVNENQILCRTFIILGHKTKVWLGYLSHMTKMATMRIYVKTIRLSSPEGMVL